MVTREEELMLNSTVTTGDEPAPLRGLREEDVSEEDLQTDHEGS